MIPSIPRDESVTIVGPKKSGKTILLKLLLRTRYNAIVLDTKRNEDWRMVGQYIKPDQLNRIKSGRFIYRVPDFMQGSEPPAKRAQSALLEGLLRARNRTIGIDELADWAEKTRGLTLVTKRGRADRVTIMGATQRPCDVDLSVLSEAEHFFIYHLRLADDRKRVDRMTSGAKIPWGALQRERHTFVYIDPFGNVHDPDRIPEDLALFLRGRKEGLRRIA